MPSNRFAIREDSDSRSGRPHRARAFDAAPDAATATALLAEIAEAPSLYSAATADRPLALYGGGNLGRLAREFLAAVGRDFDLVIDRNARELARQPGWSGARLVHPDDVPAPVKRTHRLAVSIVTSPYIPLEAALSALGFADIVPFYDLAESFRNVHPLSNGWFAPPLTAADRENAAEVLARWDDDISRAHHLQFLAWRRLREEWTFDAAPGTISDRYFIPEIVRRLRDDECLLDGGAHHGGVIGAFLEKTEGDFRGIVAVEPDRANRTALERELAGRLPNDPRLAICGCALADGEGEAVFHEGLGYASQLSPTGAARVAVRRIDTLGVAPTILKLHLEGGEFAALKGARETLLSHRPMVAATVYHNADGIWKTPLWLMRTLPDYRFLFRAHSWCGTGAVVYAIPDEREAGA